MTHASAHEAARQSLTKLGIAPATATAYLTEDDGPSDIRRDTPWFAALAEGTLPSTTGGTIEVHGTSREHGRVVTDQVERFTLTHTFGFIAHPEWASETFHGGDTLDLLGLLDSIAIEHPESFRIISQGR